MNCHGHDTRVRIVKNYNIRCTAHIRLLNGQVIRSDAERDITDTYYIFECVNKNDDNDVDRIVCGTGAARDLLQLANITAPPIFNMLHEVGGEGGAGGAGGAGGGNQLGDCICQIETGNYVILFETKTEPESSYFTDSAFLHVGSEVYLKHKSDKTFGIVVKNWEDERKGRYGSEVYNTPIWKTIDKYVYQLSYLAKDSCYGNVKISIL